MTPQVSYIDLDMKKVTRTERQIGDVQQGSDVFHCVVDKTDQEMMSQTKEEPEVVSNCGLGDINKGHKPW